MKRPGYDGDCWPDELQTSLLRDVSNATGAIINVDGVDAPDLTPEQRANLRAIVPAGASRT